MNRNFKGVAADILSIFVILAIAFPVTGHAHAEGESPYLRAFPDQNFVDGSYWPAEQSVNLTINGTPFGPQTSDVDGYVTFDLAGYDLQRGDMLTMSSGEAPPVVYQARQLVVGNIDLVAQTISGTVDGLQTVHVWVGAADEYVYTDGDGNWTVDLSGYGHILYLGACGNAEAWGAETSASSTIIDWCVPLPPLWRDEFNGPLADGWYWSGNDNPANRGFNDGFLRIDASSLPTGGENLLLRPVGAGDFSIETRLLFTPDADFQFAGLVIWQDEYNFLQFGRAFCDVEGACVGNGIYFDKSLEGSGDPNNFATQIENPFDPAEAYLRLERRGEMVRALYSQEGISWTEIGTHSIPSGFQVNGVGLTNSQNFFSASGNSAYFDYFELTEGWGFLPEGFHDGESGDVPAWACNANGWAVDPDDRAVDIAVEIDVDGTALPDWIYAGEYREDLDNAGVCDSGNCGFSASLWGTISSYETHSIVTYAQDIPSGEWVLLYNSPKELTCRTYDIYAYDPLTGETKQISNLRDADEYNPSWSPNGKMVAHDVLFGDGSYGIYITDLKTDLSTLLVDGGNDAVWSPNGKWIAFDRAWTDDPHIYIIPASGGTPTIAREFAMSADWAPNGKRLVFTDYNDGSVRTVAVDGGGGAETTIAPIGYNPVWSPDGNWIAYDFDGDIWKVQVNIQGVPLGDPIQVTSGPFIDGQPTWSPDSLTIVYHSGFTGDWDLWSVPATGGTPTWLTGAVVFGDYDPSYAKNSPTVGYASFSPNGQAVRTWVAAFTYDLPAGYWTEGTHTYHFETAGTDNTPDISFGVLNDEPLFDGTVLLRPWSIIGRTGEECIYINEINNAINPDQQTKFYVGWTADGTYPEALTYYENLMAKVTWDSWLPVDLVQHEIFPITSSVDWFGYVCTFTAP